MTFCHYGDYGDVVYCLSAIKELCDEYKTVTAEDIVAELCLSPCEGPREIMTQARADTIIPLLNHQSYLKSKWVSGLVGVRLHTSLNKYCRDDYNIADRYNNYLNIEHSPRNKSWLRVDNPRSIAPIVVSRTARHHSERGFPWKRIINLYEGDIVFVGLDQEYEEFCWKFDADIKHCKTSDLLEVAEIIAGCDLFIGNQSAARAIAEGLKVAVVVEQYNPKNDTHWNRPGAWFGDDIDFWCDGLDKPKAASDLARYIDYLK